MRSVVQWMVAAILIALSWNHAAADDLPVLTYRHLWTLPPAENPPDVEWHNRKERGISDAWVTDDGGLMIWAYERPSIFYNIKLDADGAVQFWKKFYACPDEDPCNLTSSVLRIVKAPDGGAFVQLHYALIGFDPDGNVESRIPIPGDMQIGHITTLVARDGSIYFAGLILDEGGGRLYRVDADGEPMWELFVPLSVDGQPTDGWPGQIDEMANGDILWSMSDYWYDYGRNIGENQWRLLVTPDGQLRHPDRVTEGILAPGDNSWEPGVAYLRDGRLLRYVRIEDGEDSGQYRLEFWDGIRDRLLSTRLVDLRSARIGKIRLEQLFFVDGSDLLFFRGHEAFRTPGVHYWIFGLDDAGTLRWRAKAGSFTMIGIPGTSSFYVIDTRWQASGPLHTYSVYMLELDIDG